MVSKETNNLLTKFFYRDNYLHFQILVQTATDTQICGEFTNYDEYQKSFEHLQSRLSEFKGKTIGKTKNFSAERALANMAWFSELVKHNQIKQINKNIKI